MTAGALLVASYLLLGGGAGALVTLLVVKYSTWYQDRKQENLLFEQHKQLNNVRQRVSEQQLVQLEKFANSRFVDGQWCPTIYGADNRPARPDSKPRSPGYFQRQFDEHGIV